MTVQIFVYKFIVYNFSEKGKKNHETFHILKMKKHFEKEPRFENGSSIKIVHRTTYLQILWLVHCDVKDNASEKGSCSSVPSALLCHTLTFSWAQLLLQILQNL